MLKLVKSSQVISRDHELGDETLEVEMVGKLSDRVEDVLFGGF